VSALIKKKKKKKRFIIYEIKPVIGLSSDSVIFCNVAVERCILFIIQKSSL
jgi:hypothetical protein